MINYQNIDTKKLSERFAKTNSAVINDFLVEPFAEKLRSYYRYEMPENQWVASSYPSLINGNKHEFVPVTEENRYTIQIHKSFSNKCLNDDQYAYFFYRTLESHKLHCLCPHCTIMKLITSVTFIDTLNDITQLNLKRTTTVFANKYTEKCFLATHTDDGNGRLAFVLHLTKNWNPCWGGLYMDQSDMNNIKTIIPSFNKFVMFRVGDNQTPHSVSSITENITHQRISVTGWFD